MIERLILIGLINSDEFTQYVRPVWDSNFIESNEIYYISQWCIEYFDRYNKVPSRYVEDIYFQKKEDKEIPSDLIKSISKLIEDLTFEYDKPYNLQYALDQAQKYFKKRHLENHRRQMKELTDDGNVDAAESLASNYKAPVFDLVNDLDFGKEESLKRIKTVFATTSEPMIMYPGPLGEFVNDQLVRGNFVALMGSEKRGKSYWLLDMAIRASRRYKVALFQAGDMNEDDQIKRTASYLAKLPYSEKYVGETYVPVADCIRNQLDICDKKERRCGFGIFTGGEYTEENLRNKITREDLIEAYKDFGEDYIPCTNCSEFHTRRLGTPWLVPKNISHTVNGDEAQNKIKKFFQDKHRSFRVSTYPNNTLTVSEIKNVCGRWEQIDGFIPDVILIDYADLLVPEKFNEFRHGQNEIWKNLRALSQSRNCLVITATQADAKSYEKNLLTISNYSEDKRKYAHVTAMFGLNQDKNFREKKLGIMRINQLVLRSGDFDSTGTVTVLQNINLGRPFLDSYT